MEEDPKPILGIQHWMLVIHHRFYQLLDMTVYKWFKNSLWRYRKNVDMFLHMMESYKGNVYIGYGEERPELYKQYVKSIEKLRELYTLGREDRLFLLPREARADLLDRMEKEKNRCTELFFEMTKPECSEE